MAQGLQSLQTNKTCFTDSLFYDDVLVKRFVKEVICVGALA